MILEIIFFVCLLIGFVNARSIQIADRSPHGRYYIIFPSSKILSWFAAILMFLGMISLFAIIIWGFIYIKWYIVVGSFIFQGAVVLLIISIIYALGTTIIDLTANYYPYILPALITLVATVVYFKKKEIKKIYTTIENNLKNKVSKITENFILRTIIVILIVIILYLIIK